MIIAALVLLTTSPSIKLDDRGATVVLSNDLMSVTIDKATATIPDLRLGNSPNLAGKGGYFAVANSGGKDGWDIKNGRFRVIRNTPELVEVATEAPVGGCLFDQHYVVKKGEPGFYVFVKMARPAGLSPENFGQVRWSFYLNPNLFTYEWSNDDEHGIIPDLTGAEKVQDATYRTKDGAVYTKYNLVDYVDGHYVHGITGQKPGSYGAFVVMGSNECLGAPTKQYITVHSGPIIHRFLNSGHFMPRGLVHPALPDNWTKFCGPWFIYLNRGDTPQAMWADAKRRAEQEKRQWPYGWVQDSQYPVRRASVSGQLVKSGGSDIADALIVMTTPGSDWQTQILDYNYSVHTDRKGRFELPAVRPGTYSLHAVIPEETEEFQKETVTVGESGNVKLGRLEYSPSIHDRALWQIGQIDRTTRGFRLSDQPRQYGLEQKVPASLTYRIGSSRPDQDWYYCQAKAGDWNVEFDRPVAVSGELMLTLGIAGQTNDPRLEVLLNGVSIGQVTTAGNSSAQYRSAILGSSYYEVKRLTFPSTRLQPGKNTLTLRLSKGAIHYDTVRLSSLLP